MKTEPTTYERRKNRRTGTHVIVEPSEDVDGGAWQTVCDEHGYVVCHDTLRIARSWAAAPDEWCEDCRVIIETNNVQELKADIKRIKRNHKMIGELFSNFEGALVEQLDRCVERQLVTRLNKRLFDLCFEDTWDLIAAQLEDLTRNSSIYLHPRKTA